MNYSSSAVCNILESPAELETFLLSGLRIFFESSDWRLGSPGHNKFNKASIGLNHTQKHFKQVGRETSIIGKQETRNALALKGWEASPL